MIIRHLENVKTVDWGNGTSRRFLLAGDGMGYTVTDTIVTAGSRSRLEYKNHLEACYCIAGKGEVVDAQGNTTTIAPGTLYALDSNDAHELIASDSEDLRLVCVFTPPLEGDERHNLESETFSEY